MKRIAIAADRKPPQGSAFCYKQIYTNEAYTNAILKAGGTPLIVPYCEPTFTDTIIDGFDGLLLTGGNDISPILYGEENNGSLNTDEELDRFHMALVTSARKKGIPILGICRGFQLLNISFGGTLFQDLQSESPFTIDHRRLDIPYDIAHDIELVEDSLLYSVLKEKRIGVNSLHHQGIKTLGFGIRPTAFSSDGLIEGFEGYGTYGVQWHPEAMGERMEALFKGFVASISKMSRV